MTQTWRPGMTCEGYTLVQSLGSGAFGEVWLAEDAAKQRVALKFLPIRRDEKIHAQFFKQEFALLSELRHAHLARVFDFGVTPKGDYYFFTEEVCPGENFLKATEGKSIPFFEVCLVQLLAALDYIHAMGIVHFDIKAENILIEEREGRPHVKVLDFGVAAKLKNLPEFVGGTLTYMAPELFQRSRYLNHRVDLYSLGVLCLKALTGRLPFATDNPKAVMRWHVEGTIPESLWEGRSVPKHLREITEKLLKKRPEDRFSSARVAINFLNQTTGHRYRNEEHALQPQVPAEGPLVGRDELLAALKKTIEEFGVFHLSGEQGIGKSRLLSEVRRWLEWKEIRFFQIRHEPRASLWNDLCRWLGRRDPYPDEPDERTRARRHVDLIFEEAKKRPLGLLMDDGQRADGETRLFLSELVSKLQERRAAGRPVPCFAVFATEEEGGMPRLGLEEVSQYCERVLGKLDGLDRLSQLLFSYSGGLPLLMVEGLRFIAPHFLKGEPLEDLLPPAGLAALYDKKVDALSPEEKELVFVLALLNRPARADELSRILGKPLEDLPKLMAQSQRAGLLGARHAPNLLIHNGNIQLSSQALGLDLIRRLDEVHKADLHRRIATGLDGLDGSPPVELGSHWAQAPEKEAKEKGRHYFRLAAAHLKEMGHLSRAAKYLDQAISLSEKGSPEWAAMVEEEARLKIATGDFNGAASSLDDLERTAPRTAALEELQGLLAFKKRDWPSAKTHYEEALRHFPQNDPVPRIGIENALANIALQSGRYEEAARLFQGTLETEKRLDTDTRSKIAGNNLGLALCRLGRFDEAVLFYEDRLRERGREPREEVMIRNALGYVFIQASRFAEAIACLEQARRLTENHGGLHVLFSVLGNLVTAYFKEARYVENLHILKETVSWQERLGSERDIAYTLLRQGSTHLVLGMEEAAQDCFERGLSKIRDTDPVLACWFRLMEAYREREYGDREKTKVLLHQILAEKDLPDRSHLAWAALTLADILHDEGKADEARSWIERIPEDFKDDEFGVRRDLLAAKMSDQEPETLFPSLEERCRANHFLELLWEVHHAWGRALLRSGDRAQALAQLEKGAAVLRRISEGLPEEYRDRYLHFKERVALFRDLETLQN